jgi:hypothetical protein
MGQHNVVKVEKALVNCGASRGIVGDDMLVLEGNEHFVDVSGLDRHKEKLFCIITSQALIQTHKGFLCFTKWPTLERDTAYYLSSKWNTMVLRSTIDVANYQVVNNAL